MNKPKLSQVYADYIRMLQYGKPYIDVVGDRIWLMRKYGYSNYTAKCMARMFHHWMAAGVYPQ